MGDRIAILGDNSPEQIFLLGAAARLGAVVIPVNCRLHPGEITYILNDCRPKFLIVDIDYADIASSVASETQPVEKRYIIGGRQSGFEPFDHLMEGDGRIPDAEPALDDGYIVIYTAAVHGKPRGAALIHQNVLFSNFHILCTLGLTRRDVHLCVLPLFHIAGLAATFATMQAGGTNILMKKFDAGLALEHIRNNGVTLLLEFPPILKTLLDKASPSDLATLKHVVGIDQEETIRKLGDMSGATFWTGYAQTETSGFVSLAPFFEKLGSAGKPLYACQIGILDDAGSLLGPGKSGEIALRGPTVFAGYWNREGDNRYTFRGDWHHTGDMGRMDTEGYVWYEGRTPEKELIKTGGENVYPAEVERAIVEHPGVDQAVVIGIPDPEWGEAVMAVCVLKGGRVSKDDLIEFVAKRIARYKKPKKVVYVSSLPKNPDGTIDRMKVKHIYG